MDKNKIDQAVLQLLTKVREKKEAIKKTQKKPQWVTSCTLSLNSDSGSVQDKINIQTLRDTDKLLEICAFLQHREESMKKAAVTLNLEYGQTYIGYTVPEWLTDLKTRVRMLQLDRQKQELDTLNKRVDKLVTPEQRREMELVELQKLLEV